MKLQHTTQRSRSRLLFMHTLGRYTLANSLAVLPLQGTMTRSNWAVACWLYVEGYFHHSELTFLGDRGSLGTVSSSSRLGPMSTPELHGLMGVDAGF